MELFFASLAFGSKMTAVILASLAVISIIYSLRLRRSLTLAAYAAAGLHLVFILAVNLG